MDIRNAPEPPVNWQGLLGYLNYSEGKPDPRFAGQLHAACRLTESGGLPALVALLDAELTRLHRDGAAAFREIDQARAVIRLAFGELPRAYREHHREMLASANEADLFAPFFLVRAAEATLAVRSRDGGTTVVTAALERLNDFVGYRPTPVLESRRAGELYDHERFRPVPIYLRDVGVAAGRFQSLVGQAFTILAAADTDLLEEGQFDLALLEEFALDPRPYDHNHPANRRPNHVFGEWDPHHLDAQGRYRRFVVRQSTLDAMLARVDAADGKERNERLFEASAVLAGTMLMASALCGRGPNAHDSTTTLATLVPQIARQRDRFYERLIATIPGPRGDRLRAEATHLRQPFGGVRQDLNQRIALERAGHLQERHVALLYATLGYPEASKQRAAPIATASVRLAAAVRGAIATADLEIRRGEIGAAARALKGSTELIHRGIACGALADPWSMLGFQGLYPLFQSREDSIHDPRVEELLGLIGDTFEAYAHAQGEAAARDRDDLRAPLAESMQRLAEWWDQFAGYEIQDLPRVHGGEAAAAAEHVATALARWRQREQTGQAPDLAFWRQHLEGFQTPTAFARVVSALLDRGDAQASMGLLMAWLSQTPDTPLEDGDHSFHTLARRWMNDVAGIKRPADRAGLVRKFLELLEVNAESLWDLPEVIASSSAASGDDGNDNPFESAYEGVTFRDSADDGTEGAVLGDAPSGDNFDLEGRDEDLRNRFQFLATVADLWRSGAPWIAVDASTLRSWLRVCHERVAQFPELLAQLHALAVPAPLAGFESAYEYDRRRALKEQLIEEAIGTALAMRQAERSLSSRVTTRAESKRDWESVAVGLERDLESGQPEEVRKRLAEFLPEFRTEPLLYVPLTAGGAPDQILRARTAQAFLTYLLERLPRIGLLRETYLLVQTARAMEQNVSGGRRVTEFDRLFPVAVQTSVDAVLDLAETDARFLEDERQEVLKRLAKHYLDLWVEHSNSLRLSVLESVDSAVKWERVRGFVQRYGRELFTVSFLQLANLRSVLHRGVENWLDALPEQDEAPEKFLDALGGELPRDQAVDLLGTVLQALVENYDEYRDYNTTTTQSDYGENVHVLLDFLRVKAAYERDNWRLRPLVMVHEVLCRRGRTADATAWHQGLIEYTSSQAQRHLDELAALEERHGLRLRSVRDRLQERFVAPLIVDRLSALLAPAWKAAQAGANEDNPAFVRLREEIAAFAATPTGVGLEVPPWLRRLERDLLELRRAGQPKAVIPLQLTLDDLRSQLVRDWDKANELE